MEACPRERLLGGNHSWGTLEKIQKNILQYETSTSKGPWEAAGSVLGPIQS